MKKLLQTIKDQEGFGMVELLVTVIILSIGLFGLMNLMGNLVKADRYSTSDFISLNLAREGIEIIRNKRDSNWIQGNVWDTGFANGVDYSASLNYDIPTSTWELNFEPDSLSDNLTRLYQDDGTHIFNHESAGTETQFNRLLTLLPICLDEVTAEYTIRNEDEACLGNEEKVGIEIHSVVGWNDGSLQEMRKSELISTIYNWR